MNPLLDYQFDWDPVLNHFNLLLNGIWIDLWGAATGFALALVLGLLLAIMRTSGSRLLAGVAFAYVQLVRGFPIYVLLVWIYFGVATAAGILFSALEAMIITLAITGSAYATEIFRAGLEAVDRGHIEAAQSLGLGKVRTYTDVVLPQVVRLVIPPFGNTLVALLKGATIVSVIGAPDMVYQAQEINVTYFTPFEAFAAVGALLICVVLVISGLAFTLERRLRLP